MNKNISISAYKSNRIVQKNISVKEKEKEKDWEPMIKKSIDKTEDDNTSVKKKEIDWWDVKSEYEINEGDKKIINLLQNIHNDIHDVKLSLNRLVDIIEEEISDSYA